MTRPVDSSAPSEAAAEDPIDTPGEDPPAVQADKQPTASIEDEKRAAARLALDEVTSGMALGLGTGSTVAHFLELLAQRLGTGELSSILGVPTSVRTAEAAARLGIPLTELRDRPSLDLTVDGADEIGPGLDLIKGLGGALLREKIVADASSRLVIIADERKRVSRLGERAPVPVEVVRFAWEVHLPFFEALGAEPLLRRHDDGEPYVTDNGNYVVDLGFAGGIPDPDQLDRELRKRVGVVESGLFLHMADRAVIGGSAGAYTLDAGQS